MKILARQPLTIACAYLWIGFVGAISLMETWINTKINGSTPTNELGRIVIIYLNKIEWVFAISIILNIVFYRNRTGLYSYILLFLTMLILTGQTFWLIPELRDNLLDHVHGHEIPPNYLHIFYLGGDAIKVICLFLLSFTMYRQID
ncbi:MAG TPA: hypothetical protein PLC76_08800 [Saprospiraceae bacterium]|jgi:hypothetical protein|nr:MAG: hypothetical protein UZ08_BCD001002303 [Candidatus Parvibacillus calidus]MBX2937521.1 hypothetical protein [Saprospiraceae bacterium]MBK7741937.1 hypothetical protein [Candidatus Parvibacillus calidus]MBX7177988.1 hypothetical protein [Saprospiraceae bacterium]MCB0592354.1 hypothetical protein [Saprospiraceae bacterium]